MKKIAAMFATISVLLASASAESVVDEVRGGILAQSCCGYAPDKEQGVAVNLDVLFKSPKFLSVLGSPKPFVGGSIATDSDATSVVYTGVEWRVTRSRFFAVGGLGGAVHDGETRFDPAVDIARLNDTLFLGCRALFRLSGDVGMRVAPRVNASIHWSHISNAGLCEVNEGLDNLGARIGLSF